MATARKSEFAIEPLFIDRWSPRDYDGAAMPEEALLTVLEAARWAPSAFNIQPWRFVYVQRDDDKWEDYCALLEPGNASWARNAAALVFVLSDTMVPPHGAKPAKPSTTHSFDAGIAFAQLALQATLLGYHAHAMAGVQREKARARLNIPDQFLIEIAVAIGSRGAAGEDSVDAADASGKSQRLSLQAIAGAGTFSSIAA